MPQQKYDAIGDVHGCINELTALLDLLGYENGVHPEGRQAIFLGDSSIVGRTPPLCSELRCAWCTSVPRWWCEATTRRS